MEWFILAVLMLLLLAVYGVILLTPLAIGTYNHQSTMKQQK